MQIHNNFFECMLYACMCVLLFHISPVVEVFMASVLLLSLENQLTLQQSRYIA